MKILVCMKQVPQKDAPLKLNESGTWIREDVSYEVNEPDAYALEEALRQKEKHGGEVVVITAGPARAQQVLREALAKGADRAIHLEDAGFVALDAFNTAKAFAAAIKDEQFDLIFTGLQSDDYGYAQTGVILAELLGWPHATIIMQIEKTDGGIKVKRELEAGFFQFIDMPLPAVLTIQSGINKLRYATLIGIKQAKNKPLRKVTLDEVKSALGENHAEDREALHPAEDQEDRDARWLACGSGEETGGETAERSARAVIGLRSPRLLREVLMHLDEKERQDYHEQPTVLMQIAAPRGSVIGFLLWVSRSVRVSCGRLLRHSRRPHLVLAG